VVVGRRRERLEELVAALPNVEVRRLSGWRSFVAGIDLLVDGGFTAV
jgi:hypothetical protein